MLLSKLLPLFIFFMSFCCSYASSHDIHFYRKKNGDICSKYNLSSILFPLTQCFSADGELTPLSLLEQGLARARILDPAENKYAPLGIQIEKPFLIIDGIHLSTEEKRSLQDFEKEANAYGLPAVLKSFGYTPILVQFPKTVEKSIKRNAFIFKQVLSYLAKSKLYPWPNGSQESYVVLGISQGGLIGRYGSYLYDSEKLASYPGIKMFVSLDSPHQGAVMPRGILAAIDFWAREAKNGSAEDFLDLISGPGASDLLIYDTKKSNSSEANVFAPNTNKDRFLFNEYREAANYRGFPSILLSQGQLKGKPNSIPKGPFYSLNRYAEKATKTWGRAASTSEYSTSNDQVFAENNFYEFMGGSKKWTLKGNSSWDLVQGSTYPFIETIYDAFESAYLREIPDRFEKTFLNLNFYGKWSSHELNSKSTSFIPTTSSLDLLCDGKPSTTTSCAHTQTETGLSWESPGNRSTGKAMYAVDKTHPRYGEESSGKHIEPPYNKDGSPKDNVIKGIQTDLWRMMCELSKADFNKATNAFENPYFIGQFNPTASCLDQTHIPESILNAGIVQFEPLRFARYDYAPEVKDITENVSFTVPAGWKKVATFDYEKDLPANGLFEVVLKMENPKSNWLKLDLILTQVQKGSNQIQLQEKTISPDGQFHTIRWQLPSSSSVLKKFRWIRLVLNSSGGNATISKVRFIKNAASSAPKPPPVPFSQIYPGNHALYTPWKTENAHDLDYKDNLGSGAKFFFEKKYDGVQWTFDQSYDLSAYKKIRVSYWPNTCAHSFIYIDQPTKNRAFLKDGVSNGTLLYKSIPLESLISMDWSASGAPSGYKLVLQTTSSEEKCIIQNISLEK